MKLKKMVKNFGKILKDIFLWKSTGYNKEKKMTVRELIEKLKTLPEKATLEMFYREYSDLEDSVGFLQNMDIDAVYYNENIETVSLTCNNELDYDSRYKKV
jgi:hypothetical protein